MEGLEITSLKGKQILGSIDKLAQLRMTVFREYPYLYDGDFVYEQKYLRTYSQCDESVLIIVRMNDEIIGASTAIPLAFETAECQKPFIENQLNVSDIFYFGESVLLPEYRKKGVYSHFFSQREKAAKHYGAKQSAFCAVVRDANDKRRPKDYVPLDEVWRHFGYEIQPNLCAYYDWKEIDQSEQTTKPMTFWMKNL